MSILMPMHVGLAPWWQQWYPEAFLFCAIVLAVYWYLIGPVRKRYGLAERVDRRYVISFMAGLAIIVLSEGTPVHALSEGFLFSVHMMQHILLVFIMPPLILRGLPPWLFGFLENSPRLLRVGRAVTHPVVGLFIFNAVYAIWHLPANYQAALYIHEVHMIQHVMFVGAAFIMWWPLFSNVPALPRLPEPGQMVYLFLLSVSQLAVYAYVTFFDGVLYQFYWDAPRVLGISAYTDQVLAGVLKKLGSMVVLLPLLVHVFFRWASREEKNAFARPAQVQGAVMAPKRSS